MNTAQDFITEIETIQKQLRTLLTMLKPNLEEFIRQECMKAFKSLPNYTGLSWTQFSPYFNDGDACTFSVNEIYLIDDEGLEVYLSDDEQKILATVESLVGIDQDLLAEVFGWDNKITYNADDATLMSREYDSHN